MPVKPASPPENIDELLEELAKALEHCTNALEITARFAQQPAGSMGPLTTAACATALGASKTALRRYNAWKSK